MDFLLELFLDFLFEGTVEIAKSLKAPKSLRIFVITFMAGIMFLLFYMSYHSREDETMMSFYFVIGSLILFFLLSLFYKFIKLKSPE